MMYKTLWVAGHLIAGIIGMVILFLPAIIAHVYADRAKARINYSFEAYDRIENRQMWIFIGGYMLMAIAVLYAAAPAG